VTIRLWVTFTAKGFGRACSIGFYGLQLGRAGWRSAVRRCQG
jgi:hypothetical protein